MQSARKAKEIIADVTGEPIKAGAVKIIGTVTRTPKSPDERLGSVFRDVQERRLFPDSKTFVDLIPKKAASQIREAYRMEKNDPNFNISDFVNRHFYNHQNQSSYQPNETDDVLTHIKNLWPELTVTNRRNRGSLLSLPYPYVVPGGRFREQFYWDSYFIMVGLAAEGQWSTIEGMMKNYAYMIRKFSFIPTANRSYFLSRSQPPFFSHMVELLSQQKGGSTLIEYLPYMLSERLFWMKGEKKLSKNTSAKRRVVRVGSGGILNRYYDNKQSPRPESHDEDIETANEAKATEASKVYVHLRAAAESGWDFSSRWFKDPADIRTIHTTDILPVDLNCLLYHLDMTIAKTYRILKQKRLERTYRRAAEKRAKLIQETFWSEQNGFYYDYDFVAKNRTERVTLAAIFPLYVGIATAEQAKLVASKIVNEFLKPGGLATTTDETSQQWDAPNGWAPLQYVAIAGLRKYGYENLANEIKNRWVKSNLSVFDKKHKLIEKYNVENPGELGGGGEYPLQDGFGWTNGVLEKLLSETN